MTFDKKPSVYADRGTIGSAEELDTYGVWVKSEPQDLAASLAEAVDFDSGAIPYEDNYDTGYGDIEDISIPEYDQTTDIADDFDIIDIESIEDNEPAGITTDTEYEDIFQEDADRESAVPDFAERDNVEPEPAVRNTTEEVSTQLLLKIAEELSSIRSELSTLKKEFADIRAESAGTQTGIKAEEEKAEISDNGFFDDGEDEKISLSGDVLTPPDFSEEADDAFVDPRRQADEAALRELERQNVEDVDVVDIDEENEAEENVEDDIPELNDEIFPGEAESDELREIRMEGVTPLNPVPEDADYLEEDPFILDNNGFEDISPESADLSDTNESGLAESVLNESALNENTFEDAVSNDASLEFTLDESDFDLSLVDFSADDTFSVAASDDEPAFDTALGGLEEDLAAPLISEADSSLSESDAGENEPNEAELEISPEVGNELSSAELPPLDDISFEDDFSLDMDELEADLDLEPLSAKDEEADCDLEPLSVKDDDDDDGIAQVIPEGFEIDAEEAAISLDDDLEAFTEEELAIDMGETIQLEPLPAKPVASEPVLVPAEDAPEGNTNGIGNDPALSSDLKSELKNVLSYMDHLLESLPEEKIEEFAKSEYFDAYKKIFKELGLV